MSNKDNGWLDDEANRLDPLHIDDYSYGNNDGTTSFGEHITADILRQQSIDEDYNRYRDYANELFGDNEEDEVSDEEVEFYEEFDDAVDDYNSEADSIPENVDVTISVSIILEDQYTEMAELHKGESEQIQYLGWGRWEYEKALLDHSPRLRSFYGNNMDNSVFDIFEMMGKNDLEYAFDRYQWMTEFFSLDILKRYAPASRDYEKWAWEVFALCLEEILSFVSYKNDVYQIVATKTDLINKAFIIKWVGEDGEWQDLVHTLITIYLRGNDIDNAIRIYNLYKATQSPSPSHLIEALKTMSTYINEYSNKLYSFALSELIKLPFSTDLIEDIKESKNTHNIAEDFNMSWPVNIYGETPDVAFYFDGEHKPDENRIRRK